MQRLFIIHLIFLGVALIIAFVLVPADLFYLEKAPGEEIKTYYHNAMEMKFSDAWKIVFTWFLGLTCGRLMLKALLKNKRTH